MEQQWRPSLYGWSLQAREKTFDASMSKEQHASFEALYRHYYPRILAYFRYRIRRSDVVIEDLTSLVFERALVHMSEVKSKDAVTAWLFRIARNCAHDYFRRQRPEVSLEELMSAENLQGDSSEEQVLANEERRSLLAHVSHLSEREQEIIGLKFVSLLTNRQIAQVLHMPEGTVGSLLYRALGKLRDAMRTEGDAV